MKTHLQILLEAYDAIGIEYITRVEDNYTYVYMVGDRKEEDEKEIDNGVWHAFIEFNDGVLASY